ncbi:MAG: DUF2275 domain-containing protein [Proteobacteria bacterium]|nr:DUF2275 domain-containing protein [Pseudomonadota bacterium]
MNRCADIEKSLSAYLEGDVTPQEQKLIGEHLATCIQCSKTLEDLKKTTELVRSLEEIEPPPWFKQKIMARVREEAEEKQGIFRKLFFPLHIKIPVEVFATCLVVVMAVYVFKSTGPEIKSFQAPSEKAQTADSVDQRYVKAVPTPAPVSKGKTVPDERYEKDTVEVSQVPKVGTGAVAPGGTPAAPTPHATPLPAPVLSVPAVPAPARAAREQETEMKNEAFQSAPSLAGALEPVHKKKGNIAASDTGSQYRLGRETHPGKLQPKASAAAKKPQTINITVKSDNTAFAGREIEDILNRSNATSIKRESRENIEIITATLPAQALKEFIEKLNAVGEVKENILLYNIPEEEITVRIEIVNSW